jgi:hypothetical protein
MFKVSERKQLEERLSNDVRFEFQSPDPLTPPSSGGIRKQRRGG